MGGLATGWPAGGGTSSRSGASGIAGRQQRAQDKFKIKATKNNAATELLSLSELPVPIMLGGKKPRIKRQVLVLTSLAHLTPRPTWPLKSPTTTKALNRVRWPARVCFCTGMIFITCRRGGWKGETCVGVRVGRKKDVCPSGEVATRPQNSLRWRLPPPSCLRRSQPSQSHHFCGFSARLAAARPPPPSTHLPVLRSRVSSAATCLSLPLSPLPSQMAVPTHSFSCQGATSPTPT